MKYEKVTLDSFSVVGIAVRTTNKDNKAEQDIAGLWQEFLENNIADAIPFKVSDDVYCIYTDYESDFMGAYTTIIGCMVSNTNDTNDEFVYKDIVGGEYYKFVPEEDGAEAVLQTWMHIWQSDYDRKYTADFDVYQRDADNPPNIKVTTFLSVK